MNFPSTQRPLFSAISTLCLVVGALFGLQHNQTASFNLKFRHRGLLPLLLAFLAVPTNVTHAQMIPPMQTAAPSQTQSIPESQHKYGLWLDEQAKKKKEVGTPVPSPAIIPTGITGRQQLPGHVIEEIHTVPLVGDVPVTQLIFIDIGLPMRNQQTFDNFSKSLYNPKSPNYRKFITPEKFGEMFGTPPVEFQKVVNFAKAHGLKINTLFKNRLLIGAEGTALDIQNTFHIRLHNYKRSDGSLFYANDTEPSVDLDVPLLHISGLNNFDRPRAGNSNHYYFGKQLTPINSK